MYLYGLPGTAAAIVLIFSGISLTIRSLAMQKEIGNTHGWLSISSRLNMGGSCRL